MKSAWWMAPVAVLLVFAGVFGGIWIGRASMSAPRPQGSVHVPAGPRVVVGKTGSHSTSAVTASASSDQPAAISKPAGSADFDASASASTSGLVRPPDQEAISFAKTFMEARVAGDQSEVDRLSSELGAVRISRPGNRLTGYQLQLLGSGDWDSFIFRVAAGYQDELPGGQVIVENLRLSWRDGLVVTAVHELASDSLAAGASADRSLYLRRGSHRIMAGSLTDLPDEFAPSGADPTIRIGVGKLGWTVVEPSYTGDRLFWATLGTHPLIGVTFFDQTGGYKLLPLEVVMEGSVKEAVWSPGPNPLVAVLAVDLSGHPHLAVWDVKAGERTVPTLDGYSGRDVRFIRWQSDGHSLAFDLKEDGLITGPWVYDVQSRTLTGP